LDDSGTSGFSAVTMAGFMAHLNQWEQLEPLLDEILNSANVPVFHAKQFYDTDPPFKTWTRFRKHSFTEELFTAAHGRIHGYSMTMRKEPIERARLDSPGLARTSAIGVCFSVILNQIMTGPMRPHILREGVSFLVESGNKNNGSIEKSFHEAAANPIFEGALRSISFVAKKQCRAIQIADFFAFYSRRLMIKHDKFAGKLALPNCPILEIMERHVPIWQKGGYSEPKAVSDDDYKKYHGLA
jgi:hypothetical protein